MKDEKSQPYGFGRRQFIAVKDTVISMLSDGFPLAQIHRKLTSEGKLTISYNALARLVRAPAVRTGKRDFLSCRDEILKMIDEGYSLAMIHDILVRRESIACGYEQFTRYVKRYRKSEHSNKDLMSEVCKVKELVKVDKKETKSVSKNIKLRATSRKKAFTAIIDEAKATNRGEE